MRIVIQTGPSEYVLCGGETDSEFTQGLDISSLESVQKAGAVRATVSKTFPRGNTATSVSFSITREHASYRECEEFVLKHHAEIPKSGTVRFIAEGSGQTKYSLSDASLESCRHRQIGVTSVHIYTFSGGDFTA